MNGNFKVSESELKRKEEDKDENLIQKNDLTEESLAVQSSQVVYITKTGTKYHLKSNCSKGNYYTTPLNDAQKDAYTPCKKCAN